MSLISVCVPVYNGALYLENCLRSIAEQRDVDIEIIVSDDNSSDGSFEIAELMQAENSSVIWKLVKHPVRLGMAGNWNHCLRLAEGNYIKVMGQDDLLYPGALVSQAGVLEDHSNVSIVVCGCDIITSRGTKLFKRPRKRKTGIYSGSEIAHECLHQRANLVGEPVTVMGRRRDFAELGGFSSTHRYYIDLEMWFRLLQRGDCSVIDDAQCAFRIHGRAVSSSSQRGDFDQFDDLPGAREHLQSLAPSTRWLRSFKAKFSTYVRSVIYRIFG